MAGLFDLIFPSDRDPVPRDITYEYQQAYQSGDKARIAAAQKAMKAAQMSRDGGVASITTDQSPRPEPFSLINKMQLDTQKYMQPTPGYSYVPEQNMRAETLEVPTNIYGNGPVNDPNALFQEQMRRQALEANKDQTSLPPTEWNDMGFSDKMKLILSGRGDEVWAARDRADEAAAKRERVLSGRTKDDDASKDPKPVVIDEPVPTPAMMPQQPVQPVQPVVDPQQQMIEQIKQQRAMLDQLYPQRSYTNPTQEQADDYGLDARERAKNMAQLAFFAGITNAAGGNWTAVGQGLTNAGAAYDTGFQRYQQALQDKATRSQTQNDQRYSDEVSRTNSAVDLYSKNQQLELQKIKTMQDKYEQSRREILDRFKTEEPKLGDYPTPEDQSRWEEWRKRFGVSMERNAYVASMNDVTK